MQPKHPLARLLCKLALLPFAWFAFVFWFETFAIWGKQASSTAPSGSISAHLFRLGNEHGNPAYAPYGLHVFLTPEWLPLPQRFGKLAFAGYCKGDPALSWQAADRLVIRCVPLKVVTAPRDHLGVHVALDDQHRPALTSDQGNHR